MKTGEIGIYRNIFSSIKKITIQIFLLLLYLEKFAAKQNYVKITYIFYLNLVFIEHIMRYLQIFL